ncbi:hypothetical protein C900_02343 [Fulvivirga imtechensis AK7]|uniref:Uncharacterized protein n=1 Tax=Fulvivirga imtechensis AK7 TaxID=1237149 RepID=L8JU47_9BACT|nr:hypothetical protein [Fulvivirga imtechensis]ELR71758.1 hypothetical protein C900_02343 [Fulvivirga imtechensis AK7]
MTEQFVISYAPQRAKERGFDKYRLDYRDINVSPGERKEIPAYNQIWFVVETGEGIQISSDYGEFDADNPLLQENAHEHGDWIVIENTSQAISQVKLIVVTLEE